MRKILVAASVTLVLSGCSILQLGDSSSPSAVPPHAPVAQSSYQLGIDLDFYWHPDQDVPYLVGEEAAWARSLGANSVLISFPLYTSKSAPYAGSATPPLAALREAVAAVRAQGLAVGVRPLLDEANIPPSRTQFTPANVSTWLVDYARLIVPYAKQAQAAGAVRFYTGAELSKFAHALGWAQVTTAVRKVFTGSLYFSANWVDSADTANLPASGGPGVIPAADAYQGMPVPISQFPASWIAKAAVLPEGTVLAEVGIAARWGAQWQPYVWQPSDAPLYPQLQAAWFTAACDAVRADHLGGIYFWSVYVGQPLNVAPTPQTANSFVDSPGQTAIQSCFKTLGGSR